MLLIDTANVLGSRPDGWWRDRAGATARLLDRVAGVDWPAVATPSGSPVDAVVAVVEGRARDVPEPAGVRLVRAPGSGDDAIVATAAGESDVLLVTADRGLRARLPGAETVGPGWLWAVLD
ncbi:hypothetical protein [Modestobacter sp. Leaf380]|uniref:hypothetical protein n=1 Tax=Modestobacter sp. Leaf380 TaxID=1736356 RepID=UPI000AD232AC|nr:hypothetical protein [Modestobacter sp. Leaf380]